MHSSNRKVRKGLRNPTDCHPDSGTWRELWLVKPRGMEESMVGDGTCSTRWFPDRKPCTQVFQYIGTSPVSHSGRRTASGQWTLSFSLGLVCLALRARAYFTWISPYEQVEVSVSLPPQQEIPTRRGLIDFTHTQVQFLKLWRSSFGATRRRHVEQDGQDGECAPSTAP